MRFIGNTFARVPAAAARSAIPASPLSKCSWHVTIPEILVSRQEAGVNSERRQAPRVLVRLDAKFQEVIYAIARAGARAAQIAEGPSAVDQQRLEGPVTGPGIISGRHRFDDLRQSRAV
jgi:hypothetical protein